MEIYIVRHGETVWNAMNLLQGRADIELNESGREVAGKTGEALETVHFDKIYSSPLIRAYETACLIRGHRNIAIERDERLRELCFGVSEGHNFKEMQADLHSPFYHFFRDPEKYYPPEDGESFEEICERTASFMKEVVEPQGTSLERIMIVGHGAMNKAIMCHVLGHGIDEYWSGGLQKNCNVIIVDYDGKDYHLKNEGCIFY